MATQVDVCEVGPATPDGPWHDVSERIRSRDSFPLDRVAILNAGMVTGRPSVMLLIPMKDVLGDPDGTYIVVETSGDMWETIAAGIRGARARWGVPDRP